MAKSRKYQRSRRKSARKSGKRIRKSARKTNTRKRKQRGGEGEEDALIEAAEKGHIEVVELLLANPAIDVNKEGSDGETALYVAVDNDRTKVVELLLANPAIDVNNADRFGGLTALYLTAYYGNTAITELLLAHPDIDPHKADNRGETPLQAAERRGNPEVADAIRKAINSKRDKNALNKVSATAVRNSVRAYDSGQRLRKSNQVLGNKDLAGVIGSYLGGQRK